MLDTSFALNSYIEHVALRFDLDLKLEVKTYENKKSMKQYKHLQCCGSANSRSLARSYNFYTAKMRGEVVKDVVHRGKLFGNQSMHTQLFESDPKGLMPIKNSI